MAEDAYLSSHGFQSSIKTERTSKKRHRGTRTLYFKPFRDLDLPSFPPSDLGGKHHPWPAGPAWTERELRGRKIV